MAASSAPELLIAIVDASPRGWAGLDTASPATPLGSRCSTFREFQAALETYLCAFAALSRRNRLAVLAHNGAVGGFLIPDAQQLGGGSDFVRSADVRASLRELDALRYGAAADGRGGGGGGDGGQPDSRFTPALRSLAACLSLAVCHQAKLQRTALGGVRARILVLQAAPDVPGDYIAVINAVYSAQRGGVVVDSVLLASGGGSGSGGKPPASSGAGGAPPPPTASVFLQQASYLTNGTHSHPAAEQHANLLAYLVFLYGADAAERAKLLLPPAHNVDLRAHCFCHRQHRTSAWVCSTCLSIYCAHAEVCAMCGATSGGGGGDGGAGGPGAIR